MSPLANDINFHHFGSNYQVSLVQDLVQGAQSDHSVTINGVKYAVLGVKGKLETACQILNSISLDSILTMDDIKSRVNALNLAKLIDKLSLSVEDYYIFPEIGKKCSDYLKEQLKNGAYDFIDDPEKLCEAFTRDLFKIANDKHMHVTIPKSNVDLSPPTLEELNGPYLLPDLMEPHYEYKSKLNGGDAYLPYEIKTGLLKTNEKIGYVDFRDFGNCKYVGEKPKKNEKDYEYMIDFENRKSELIAAFNHIKTAETIIIDLRNNGGGHDNCVHLLCSLFVDKKESLSRIEWREGDSRQFEEAFTLTEGELPKDQRLLTQNIMILIGPDTFSAAEAFATDMQALGKAKIVGSASAGGANPSKNMHQIGEFIFRIPDGEAINPILESKGLKNWEGVGVTPDYAVEATNALEKAIELSHK